MSSTPGSKAYARQQNANLLLLNNILSCQPGASPFTLILDSIEQPARDLLNHYIHHASVRIAIVPTNVLRLIKVCSSD